MKEEKIIVPANGYLMLFVFLILVIGSIAAMITTENPIYILGIVAAFLLMFGFIMVQPNGSRVLLLFGEYVGTIKKMVFTGSIHFTQKRKYRSEQAILIANA